MTLSIIKLCTSKCSVKYTVRQCFGQSQEYLNKNNFLFDCATHYYHHRHAGKHTFMFLETNPLQYFESIKYSIHIPEINMDEVRTIISAITNSASGYDELPASILKQCSDSYLEPSTLLINLSISRGIVPDKLKIARFIPISKGEDEQLVQAPNDTAYKRWSCHSGFKLLCKLCRTSPPTAVGARFTIFGHAGHADPLDGWRCCSQKRVMSRPIQVRQL